MISKLFLKKGIWREIEKLWKLDENSTAEVFSDIVISENCHAGGWSLWRTSAIKSNFVNWKSISQVKTKWSSQRPPDSVTNIWPRQRRGWEDILVVRMLDTKLKFFQRFLHFKDHKFDVLKHDDQKITEDRQCQNSGDWSIVDYLSVR